MNKINQKNHIEDIVMEIDDAQVRTIQIIHTMVKQIDQLEKRFKESSKNKKELADIVEIKFVGIEFDYDKVKQGEKEANNALEAGFVPLKDVQTSSGIVLILVKRAEEVWDCQEFN